LRKLTQSLSLETPIYVVKSGHSLKSWHAIFWCNFWNRFCVI